MSVQLITDKFSFPMLLLAQETGFKEDLPVMLVETENDPVDFTALNIVCPVTNKQGEVTTLLRKLVIKAAEAYSRESGLDFHLFFSPNDSLYVLSASLNTEEDSLLKYAEPKRKIGTYTPLVVLNAPPDLEKPFEIMPDGKLIFTDSWGIRIKDMPGFVLNDCYPGSDGAVYSIDYSPELKEWTLYKCRRKRRAGNGYVISVEKVGRSLSVIELNADVKSARMLFDELDKANICLTGAEVIALGLPIHNGSF